MTTKDDSLELIGKNAYSSIAEMVAALDCDYDRLEELRDERDGWELGEEQEGELVGTIAEEWAKANPDEAAELAELEADAAGGDVNYPCKDREEAEQKIQEDALSIEFRSGWVSSREELGAGSVAEFRILLTTGGPAVRIVGEVNEHGEPDNARLEVQDWGTPWTEYREADEDVLLSYCRCFYMGE